MGKDFTPQQHHYADMRHGFSKERLVLYPCDRKGKETILYDPEWEICKRYPNLAFLTNEFKHMNIDIIDDSEKTFWDDIENAVTTCVDERNHELPHEFQFVWQWYTGRLDPDFYYSERNEEMFFDECEKIKKTWKKEK